MSDLCFSPGTAPEPILDPLSQLLRALLVRFPEASLGPLRALLTSTPALAPSNAALAGILEVLRSHPGLRSRLLPLLGRALGGRDYGPIELSGFRDMACDVWGYCQGTAGLDKLDKWVV